MNQLFIQKRKVPVDNIADIFVYKLAKVTNKIYNDFYKLPKSLKLTKEEQLSFEKNTVCHICQKPFEQGVAGDAIPRRDHCHFTGQYRGAAHNSCNLQCRKPMILPVIFHNLHEIMMPICL